MSTSFTPYESSVHSRPVTWPLQWSLVLLEDTPLSHGRVCRHTELFPAIAIALLPKGHSSWDSWAKQIATSGVRATSAVRKKPKIASTNKNSPYADTELYWKQQGSICTFMAFSFKKCLKRNANKNAMLARIARLSFIPNSRWKTVNNHVKSGCRNPSHLSHCAYYSVQP